jgi:hypothetical protein
MQPLRLAPASAWTPPCGLPGLRGPPHARPEGQITAGTGAFVLNGDGCRLALRTARGCPPAWLRPKTSQTRGIHPTTRMHAHHVNQEPSSSIRGCRAAASRSCADCSCAWAAGMMRTSHTTCLRRATSRWTLCSRPRRPPIRRRLPRSALAATAMRLADPACADLLCQNVLDGRCLPAVAPQVSTTHVNGQSMSGVSCCLHMEMLCNPVTLALDRAGSLWLTKKPLEPTGTHEALCACKT